MTPAAILAKCIRRVVDADDGRAVSGAIRACHNALMRAGTAHPIAADATLAAVRVGARIAEVLDDDLRRRVEESLP